MPRHQPGLHNPFLTSLPSQVYNLYLLDTHIELEFEDYLWSAFCRIIYESVVRLVHKLVPIRLLTRLVCIVDRFRCHGHFYRWVLELWGFVHRSGVEGLVHKFEDQAMR